MMFNQEMNLISRDNFEEYASILEREGGMILKYSPSMGMGKSGNKIFMGNADFHLFEDPRIRKDGTMHSNGRVNQPGSRNYFLRRKMEIPGVGENLMEYFNILNVGEKYAFEIHKQSIASCGLLDKTGFSMYVPNEIIKVGDALGYSLGRFIEEINIEKGEKETGLNRNLIENVVKYSLNDLRNRRVVDQNIAAGELVDACFGV